MELHPYLERDQCPNSGLWYVLSAVGESPSVRVGHTCTYVPGPYGYGGRVLVVGGANPSETFGDLFVLHLETFSWDRIDVPGFKPRYEHSAFIAGSKPNKLYVYGGGDQQRNHQDIQVYDMDSMTWSTISPVGDPPSARTYHNATVQGDRFYVYSGGHSMADPVSDRQVHCFDAGTESWSTVKVKGQAPKPRHGHSVTAVGDSLYLHGGMSCSTFYDDLHVLDLSSATWSLVKPKRGGPPARAAHAVVSSGNNIHIFGGMSRDGALDDQFVFDTKTKKWSKVSLDGPAPAPRLDFGSCVIRLKVPKNREIGQGMHQVVTQTQEVLESQLFRSGSAGSSHNGATCLPAKPNQEDAAKEEPVDNSTNLNTPEGAYGDSMVPIEKPQNKEDSKIVEMFLVLGGMDTEGEIFDDCLVFLLE